MTLTNLVAKRIKELCKSRKLSINQLATMSGLAYSTVNSIVRETSKSPTLATLVRIASALNLTIIEFLNVPEIVDFSFEDENDTTAKSECEINAPLGKEAL